MPPLAIRVEPSDQLDDLELSTRILIERCFAAGITVELLDRTNNFLRLSQGDVTHYVRQATKSGLDSYMTFLVMENKQVCKLVLHEAGVRVPTGVQVASAGEAMQYYHLLSAYSVVVKPTTTNFGIGIHFLPYPFSEGALVELVHKGLQHDNTVLIEELLPGDEYRFLVVDDRVEAVCQRIPANVVGDGESSIAELVAKKNDDRRRGVDHKSALEKIQLGEVELKTLQEDGLRLSSVPAEGKQIFLRRNSNISTGGDSVDRTDDVPTAYKEIAESAARAAKSRITGVDMIIRDLNEPPRANNHGVIEMNFNPVLYIHEQPFLGTGRPVTDAVLRALGFTV
jgi:glutamate--cysteine ligase